MRPVWKRRKACRVLARIPFATVFTQFVSFIAMSDVTLFDPCGSVILTVLPVLIHVSLAELLFLLYRTVLICQFYRPVWKCR